MYLRLFRIFSCCKPASVPLRARFIPRVPVKVLGSYWVLSTHLSIVWPGEQVNSLHRCCVHSHHSSSSPQSLSFPHCPGSQVPPSRPRSGPSALFPAPFTASPSVNLPFLPPASILNQSTSLHLLFPIIAPCLFLPWPLSQTVIIFIYVSVYLFCVSHALKCKLRDAGPLARSPCLLSTQSNAGHIVDTPGIF